MLQNLQSSYMEDISVANIARHMGLDRSYFSRIFTKYEGVSPSQYLVSLRLARAAELLSEKSCTPAEAAQGCGYFDAVNFSRMLRRRYGVSPSQYRKKRLR